MLTQCYAMWVSINSDHDWAVLPYLTTQGQLANGTGAKTPDKSLNVHYSAPY
jgi:hypothetical protein